jgi:hypothetical protein
MQKGFKKVVASLIKADPGLSPEEYAQRALQSGLCGSDSKNAVFSLSTTLRKEVREKRMPEIKAVKVAGKLRFFPTDYDIGQQASPPKKDSPLTILLPPDISNAVDTLVEGGWHANRGEGLIWLAREGIKTSQQKLNDAARVTQQIRRLKESVHI